MKYLAFAIVLFLSGFAYAADINVSLLGSASTSVSAGTKTGADGNINDDNLSTSVSISNSSGVGATTITYTQTITFDKQYNINKIVLIGGFVGIDVGLFNYGYMELYYSGSWHNVKNISGGDFDEEGDWKNCSGIRLSVSYRAIAAGTAFASGFTQELQAWSPPLKGNQVITFF